MITLGEAVDRAEVYAADCFDAYGMAEKLVYVGSGRVQYPGEEDGLFGAPTAMHGTLNQYAYVQLVERLGGPHASWLQSDKCPRSLEADIINRLGDHNEGKKLFLRHKGETIRAVLSDEFTKFDNREFLALTEEAVDNWATQFLDATGMDGGLRVAVVRPQVDDMLRAYVIMPGIKFDDDPSDRGGGGLHPAVYIRNSEVGNGAAKVIGAFYRGFCRNGVIYGWAEQVATIVRHRFFSRSMVRALLAAGLAEALKMSEEAAQKFVGAQEIPIDNKAIVGLAAQWATKYHIDTEATEAWVATVRTEAAQYGRSKEPTLFDFVNGATYVAQSSGDDEREMMERMAGDILRRGHGNVG